MKEVIMFVADWCDSSAKVKPLFEELKEEMGNNAVKMTLVDVETPFGVELSCKYEVRNVPTMLLVEDKRIVNTTKGYISKKQMKEIIEKWK